MNLSEQEIARYQRHLQLKGFGPEAQAKLKNGRVLVIGAGGLSCPALLYLAAAGVGRISIVDDDRVDVSNLQRQILYTESDAGLPKAQVAAHYLRAQNPFIEIVPYMTRFSRVNALALVQAHDVVVDGSDNFSTRYLANDACVMTDRPLVYGAIHGFEGQVCVFNWKGGATYRCLFPEPPEPGTVANCAEAGVLGVLPGLIGTVQACEAIKLLTGIGEPLAGRLLLWNALTMNSQTVTLAVDPKNRSIKELPPEGYGETCAVPEKHETEPAELAKTRDEGGAVQLIDVREDWEHSRGAIQPSLHIPLGILEQGMPVPLLAELDPTLPTVVYCASGNRSRRGAELLRERYGFSTASSLSGGYKAWAALPEKSKAV
jgi:adenylyltransferase/sulfurtransferase